MDAPLLDCDRLRDLGKGVGDERLRELLAQLGPGLRRMMNDALAAHMGGNPSDLRRAVHTLRGTAVNYGCVRLGRHALMLETIIGTVMDGSRERVEEAHMDALDAVVHETVAAIAARAAR